MVMGPGENAGAVDVGDGLAVRVQGGVAQPPERRRAVPGGGHRGGRHPARRLRDRRAADRGARLAALRRARVRALALPARSRGGGHRPLRQLDRGAHRGRRDLLRGPLRAELPGQRHVRGAHRARPPDALRRRGGGQRGGAHGRVHRPRRHRRRLGAGLRRAGGGRRGQAPDRADRRPLRGEEAARVLPGAAGARAAGVAPGPRRGGPDLLARARWRSKGEVGIDIDVARVPLREADMEPFEVMISESQERMLVRGGARARRRGARGLRDAGRCARPPSAR